MKDKKFNDGLECEIKPAEVVVVPDMEVVPRNQNSELHEAVSLVTKDLSGLSLDELAERIRSFASLADLNRRKARYHSAFAIIYAWGCGNDLIEVKRKLDHGDLEKWLEAYVCDTEFSISTARRYRKLADKNPSLEELLMTSATLRQAYIATGILKPYIKKDESGSARTGDTATPSNDSEASPPILKRFAQAKQEFSKLNQDRAKINTSLRDEIAIALAELEDLFVDLINVEPDDAESNSIGRGLEAEPVPALPISEVDG